MRSINLALVLVTVGVSAAIAQQSTTNPATVVPGFDLSLGYNHVNSNAPPGVSNYFGPNGGYVSGGVHIKDWFSVEGEFTGGHADNISMLGQNLTLLTFMGGPKFSYTGHRLVPYGQILFGGAHGSDSYFPTGTSYTTSATSWAFSTGGGLDVNLTRRFAIRAVEAQYLRTAFPNGTTNDQNHLMIGAGLVIKFGGHYEPLRPAPVAVQRPGEISFTCSSNVARVDQGDTLQVVGHVMTEPDKLDVNYTWTSTGGTPEGTGRLMTINTTGLAVGVYHVRGHASLVSSPSSTAECEVAFEVSKRSEPVASVSNAAERAHEEQVFHENVPDALFDYDSYGIRPDAQSAIQHAAEFLNAHPAIRVLVEGYADERGSAEYNLGLGQKRANAARDALISAGVAAERVEIISYGKEAQVCTDQDENCWQRNRRAAFSMHP